jgi:hypothetical protein
MGILPLDRRVEVLQALAQRGGLVDIGDVVEDRLVVFVDQHDHALAGRLVGADDQLGEAAGDALVASQQHAEALDSPPGARGSRMSSASRLVEHAACEVEPDDRVAARPVPMLMDMQPAKQRLAALEQLFQGIQEQALAEAARARQEEIGAAFGQARGMRGLVDVDIALLDDLAEGLDADGELLQHGGAMGRRGH